MDEFKTILDKFSNTIDELNEFQSQAAEVLECIANIDDITTRTQIVSKKALRALTDNGKMQESVINEISNFIKAIESGTQTMQNVEGQLSTLKGSFNTIVASVNSMDKSIKSLQAAVDEQKRVTYGILKLIKENNNTDSSKDATSDA
ncbi:MAG: hypothetical protein LBF12_07730 [Christensenellaceae bacterium]|jgi:conjugal transfer/entry exclusion protein|nr:hypothetical protein [Christensenellaceae bacterium]